MHTKSDIAPYPFTSAAASRVPYLLTPTLTSGLVPSTFLGCTLAGVQSEFYYFQANRFLETFIISLEANVKSNAQYLSDYQVFFDFHKFPFVDLLPTDCKSFVSNNQYADPEIASN